MRAANGFAAAVIAAVMVAPGCRSGRDPTLFGRICASPTNGKEFCVPAEDGPKSAWDKAKANGKLPIEMWVERPETMSLDELVTIESNLERWLATMDTVFTHVRDKERHAESYKATLEGKMAALLIEAKNRQKELLGQKPVDALGHFKQALLNKAADEKDPLVATIASDKQSMDAAQKVFDDAKVSAASLAKDYAGLAKDFVAYRSTEAAETEGYSQLADQASKATLADLSTTDEAILVYALAASAKPNPLVVAAMKLSAQIQQFEVASQQAIEPHADFMATHGAAMPDMTSSAMRSINAMLGYMQRRVARSDATATALIFGVDMRRKALEMLQGSSAMQEKVAQAMVHSASNLFVQSSSARVSAVKSALPMSAKLGLPYLAKRYDQLVALLQMAPLCEPLTAGWRDAGCASIRDNVDSATVALKTTLPSQLISGLAAMNAAGVNVALLDAAKAKLNAGDLKAAAVLHDVALRGTEGL